MEGSWGASPGYKSFQVSQGEPYSLTEGWAEWREPISSSGGGAYPPVLQKDEEKDPEEDSDSCANRITISMLPLSLRACEWAEEGVATVHILWGERVHPASRAQLAVRWP